MFKKYLNDAVVRLKIDVISKAIIKNHFHLLVKQKKSRDIEKLMRSLGTRYTVYFNYKYDRIGRLFQGSYKARLINGKMELEIIKQYIENNKKDDLG